ncbi:winged helix DNA-binding domain-containing protein [Chitinophaga niabensis]|uniref:Winged helix DNA-binding domain-containing protein n=1 Tax=Chitinophaga niabensis TaxID=536979 RepID=A0A1N6D5U6_9BACT|nr:winged helix DNA-binding domain-containing protein [Chitinophaga niabensis]SIN66188.1 Winged helix DNA-binding domain-containing protein [Chitinophaga niabensis]
MDITHYRLLNQQVTHSAFSEPGKLIAWMGCMQAEDYSSAKWAIGNRLRHLTSADIEKAFQGAAFFRSQVLRPAWHFVAPDDLGWLLELSAQRIKAGYKQLHNRLDITNADLKRSKTIMAKALEGNKRKTRAELLALCLKTNKHLDEIRMNFLILDAELDGLIVNGGRQGNEFVYALLGELVPSPVILEKEAAIAELARRYFSSRGPATLPDFVWWSGLTPEEAKVGFEMNKDALQHVVINGQAYWFAETQPALPAPHTVSLLPSFDEYMAGYLDNGSFKPSVILNGKVAGTWKYRELKRTIQIETQLYTPLGKEAAHAVLSAEKAYARFLGKAI